MRQIVQPQNDAEQDDDDAPADAALPAAVPAPGPTPPPAHQPADAGAVASIVAADYISRDVQYSDDTAVGVDASSGGDYSDCSHFVHDVLTQPGFDVDYTTTGDMSSNTEDFTKVDAADAKSGDVMVEGGHMGIYTGTSDAKGPLGIQIGNQWTGNLRLGAKRLFQPNGEVVLLPTEVEANNADS